MDFKNSVLFGAIAGDIIGSPYEFGPNNIKTKDFPLFSAKSGYTDDTIMTLAVAKGILKGYKNEEKTYLEVEKSMKESGRKYINAGYGAKFIYWLLDDNSKPYNSYGNGSAMRVSAAGWAYDTLDEVEKFAEITAAMTHNHKEGIKGAKAVASAIFLARQKTPKEEIKKYITDNYGYDLTKTCDEIRPSYTHVETCQQTVPEALCAFFEGKDFEDVIRTAVSLGGDCDTLTAIAGSIAEAYYPVDIELKKTVFSMLREDLQEILIDFNNFLIQRQSL